MLSKLKNRKIPKHVFYQPMVALREFMKFEASEGLILIACAIIAMILANSFLSDGYNHLLYNVIAEISIGTGPIAISKPLILWINDGLMTIFFFLVGLELKREIMGGLLSKPSQVILPIAGAIGGMTIPALTYYIFNHNNPDAVIG